MITVRPHSRHNIVLTTNRDVLAMRSLLNMLIDKASDDSSREANEAKCLARTLLTGLDR